LLRGGSGLTISGLQYLKNFVTLAPGIAISSVLSKAAWYALQNVALGGLTGSKLTASKTPWVA